MLIDFLDNFSFNDKYSEKQVCEALKNLENYVNSYKIASYLYNSLEIKLKTGNKMRLSYYDVDDFMHNYNAFKNCLDNEYVQLLYLTLNDTAYLRVEWIEKDTEFIQQLCLLTKKEQKQLYEMYETLKNLPSQQARNKKSFFIHLNYDILIEIYFNYGSVEDMRRSLNNYLQYKELLQSFILMDKLLPQEERRVYNDI